MRRVLNQQLFLFFFLSVCVFFVMVTNDTLVRVVSIVDLFSRKWKEIDGYRRIKIERRMT